MSGRGTSMRWYRAAAVVGVAAGAVAAGSASAAASAPAVASGFSISTLASGGSLSKPDDITRLGNRLFVGFQNGVGAKGEPAPGGGTSSTVQEYTLAGVPVSRWTLTGKCDGLTADPANNRLIATVNEDANSSLYTISPSAPTPRRYTYRPSPPRHRGGTDSISIVAGQILIAASAPTTTAGPALYRAQLTGKTATLTPVFTDTSRATTANAGPTRGKTEKLALTDPDSTQVVPAVSPRFAGDVVLDSQGDKELVFTGGAAAAPALSVLHTSTQVNDTAWATAGRGTLYVTDNKTNTLLAIRGHFRVGTAFTAVPSDSSINPATVGKLNLSTGAVTPFATGLGSPNGLLFVPAAEQVGAIPKGGVAAGGGSTSRTHGGPLTTGGAVLLAAAGALCLAAAARAGRRRQRR